MISNHIPPAETDDYFEVPCEYCGLLFPNMLLFEHMEVCETSLVDSTIIPCEFCGQAILMKEYNDHTRLHQREQRSIFSQPTQAFPSRSRRYFEQSNVQDPAVNTTNRRVALLRALENSPERSILDLLLMMGIKKKGIEKEELNKKFPIIEFGNTELSNEKCESCTICISDFQKGENIRVLDCSHSFHSECIDTWMKDNASCPLCKKNFASK